MSRAALSLIRCKRPSSAAGSLSTPTAISHANQDLTAAAFLDWTVWGQNNGGTNDNRKAGANLITGPSLTAAARQNSGVADTITLSWTGTDGTPTAAGSLALSGQWNPTGASDQFEDWTLPAGTASRKGGIIVGGYWDAGSNGILSLRTTLSDASAAEQLVTIPMPQGSTGTPTFTYFEWSYNAASNGQTLRVRVENLLTNRVAGNGPQTFVTLVRYGT